MSNPVSYPLDMSGTNPSNFIKEELHTVSEAHYRDRFFLVPVFSPFFVDDFKLRLIINGDIRDLVEDVDFSFALPYVTGTRTTGKAMYGAVTLNNLELNGVLSLDYRTLGGEEVADRYAVLTALADRVYSPRETLFDTLTNVPQKFGPSDHWQSADSLYGQQEVVIALNGIRDAILQNSSLTREQIESFLMTINSSVLGSYLLKTGDTMTGKLFLNGNPTDNLEAATKQYVDEYTINQGELTDQLSRYHTANYVDNELTKKVSLSGDKMTGLLELSGDPSLPLHAAPKQYVDTSAQNLQNQINGINTTIGNLSIDAVTKQYVDDKINEVMLYLSTINMNRA